MLSPQQLVMIRYQPYEKPVVDSTTTENVQLISY